MSSSEGLRYLVDLLGAEGRAFMQKTLLFEAYGKRQNFPFHRADDIPDALVRTPLQRAIQIMKRHRDVRFNAHRDQKHNPISMIITALAACQTYQPSLILLQLRLPTWDGYEVIRRQLPDHLHGHQRDPGPGRPELHPHRGSRPRFSLRVA